MEPTPDFSLDHATFHAGVRPYRNRTYRLEAETIGSKFVVHNYGHGGAGITMSWGCASVVKDIVMAHGTPAKAAVLGAGVMGLTAATLLADLNIAVTIYAEKFTPHTTSDVAGGQWSPSLVNFNENSTTAKLAYFEVLRRAKKAHEARLGLGFGVSRRWNYTPTRIGHLDMLPRDIIPAATRLAHLPFQKLRKPGYKYDTLLVEPPILLARLQQDLQARATFVTRKFMKASELAALPENVIINCTGLGSKALFADTLMAPLKGQLVFLKAQPGLDYLYSGDGYVFPRSDAVIVGGSQEPINNDTPDPVKCRRMVAHAKAVFEGQALLREVLPKWLLQGK